MGGGDNFPKEYLLNSKQNRRREKRFNFIKPTADRGGERRKNTGSDKRSMTSKKTQRK